MHSEALAHDSPPEALDEHLVALLWTLHAEREAGKSLCSMPKLCKRLNVRMSTLQRCLSKLDGCDIVQVEATASGAPAVGLTEAGRRLAEAIVQSTTLS